MIIKTLAELQEADDRTLPFSPLGLGGRMLPEDSAEFRQRVVVRHELAVNVAEGTRQSFEQLREIYAYGVLCYPIYTMVNDHALLVFEQALRDRFVDFHKGTATFIHGKTGEMQAVAAESTSRFTTSCAGTANTSFRSVTARRRCRLMACCRTSCRGRVSAGCSEASATGSSSKPSPG